MSHEKKDPMVRQLDLHAKRLLDSRQNDRVLFCEILKRLWLDAVGGRKSERSKDAIRMLTAINNSSRRKERSWLCSCAGFDEVMLLLEARKRFVLKTLPINGISPEREPLLKQRSKDSALWKAA
jgi:hypothetical protein